MNRLQSTGSVVVVACALLACFGMLVPASILSAQEGAATYPAPPPPPPPPAAQSNVWLEVPLFLDVNTDVVRPGFGVAFRSGLRWTGEGDFFQSRETWLAPYMGMSF